MPDINPSALRIVAVALALAGCVEGDVPTPPDLDLEITCSVAEAEIARGQARDGIPALTDPALVGTGTAGSALWEDQDRVVGIVLDGQAIAIPLNVFWWHEVVNLNVEGRSVVVTHSPLTGSSLAFDRAAVGVEAFGVSGLLYRNNLMMYDRATESLWPQMSRAARCGPRDGTELPMLAVTEITYGGWKMLYPDTRVVSSETGWDRDYRFYPYFAYANPGNPELLFPIPEPLDTRRPPKERALGIPEGAGGVAYPFGRLASRGDLLALHTTRAGDPIVVLWDAEHQAAMAYHPYGPDGEFLTFSVEDGRIVDDRTGSEWAVSGQVVGGPLLGHALEPVAEAFVAFWFAWPLFQPDIVVWGDE